MEDDQQFCLRWNNHQSTLIQNFDTLLESGTLVDCTLAAEGKYLKAHKVVLSACSPYFEGLLSEHYDKHPVFILKDVKFKELKAMMDYMYRGEVNISQDQLTALLKAAESLQIKGLSDNNRPQTQQPATGKAENTRPAKTASSTVAPVAADIPHASSGLTIEKNSSKVPRTSMQQVNVSDLPEDSASPQLRGLSSREGSQSPTRKRKRLRRRSLGNDDTNSMENHEASNSSDVNISAPALGVAPVAEEKTHADPADSIGRSALMQQLTKPAEEMLQMPVEKPEPSDEMIQPKSEYLDDQESVEDLTNLDDDMNDLNEMEQDNSRAGPSSHDPSQHPGLTSWHMAAGDRSNASVVGAAAGPPGAQDEVFLAAHEAAQAQRDSQANNFIPLRERVYVKEEVLSHSGEDDNTVFPFDSRENTELNSSTQDVHEKLFAELSMKFHIGKQRVRINSEHLIAVYCSQCDRTQRKVKHVTACRLCGTGYLYECVACGKRYLTIRSAQTHIQHERERTSGKCPYCDHRASRKYNLRQHIMYKHTAIHPDDYYECDRCGAKLKSKEILVKHKARVCGGGKGVKCPLCTFRTKYTYYLKNHMRTQHEDVADGERAVLNEEGYNCLDCGKVFKAVAYLRRHQERFCIGNTLHGAQYKCEHCGWVCEKKEEFMSHLTVVHADIVT